MRVLAFPNYKLMFYVMLYNACSYINFQEGIFGIYAKISHYRKWIESKMSNPEYCEHGPDTASQINSKSNIEEDRYSFYTFENCNVENAEYILIEENDLKAIQ